MKAVLNVKTRRLVKRLGQEFTPALLPADIPRGPVGTCFDWNALQCARLYPKYQYVEGIATNPEDPKKWVLHAWLTDGENAFDPTWMATRDADGKEFPVPSRYIGIIMPIHDVATFMRMTEYQGVLANRHRAPEIVKNILGVSI